MLAINRGLEVRRGSVIEVYRRFTATFGLRLFPPPASSNKAHAIP